MAGVISYGFIHCDYNMDNIKMHARVTLVESRTIERVT